MQEFKLLKLFNILTTINVKRKLVMLEKKRLNVELLRVGAAKADMDYQIEQKLEEIERLKLHIKVQEEAEKTLREKINNLEGK